MLINKWTIVSRPIPNNTQLMDMMKRKTNGTESTASSFALANRPRQIQYFVHDGRGKWLVMGSKSGQTILVFLSVGGVGSSPGSSQITI